MTYLRLQAATILLLSGTAFAQTATPAAFSGCVLPSTTEKDTYILNTPSVCAKLTGKFSAARLTGHEVDLKGVLTPASRTAPAAVHIDSITSVGKACSEVCSLYPPGKRGLSSEKPGKEGGTPGAVPTPPPPPNR